MPDQPLSAQSSRTEILSLRARARFWRLVALAGWVLWLVGVVTDA